MTFRDLGFEIQVGDNDFRFRD